MTGFATTEHAALSFLLAAHAAAVDLANSATPGPWHANEYNIGMGRFAASIGTRAADVDVLCAASDIVGNGHEGRGDIGLGDAQFIASQPPENVLRRVEAERELLAVHKPEDGVFPDRCPICITDRSDWTENWDYDKAPCATVLLIAKAWGWTA